MKRPAGRYPSAPAKFPPKEFVRLHNSGERNCATIKSPCRITTILHTYMTIRKSLAFNLISKIVNDKNHTNKYVSLNITVRLFVADGAVKELRKELTNTSHMGMR